jgi:hypothetical protein
MATLNFDANQYDPASGRDPLPAGKYLVSITSTEMKPTRNGAGQYLECEYQVLDGQHKGRRVWSRHTLNHPNEQTVQIAREQLSAICHAVGVMTPQDSAELHNLPLTITVKVTARSDTGEPTNDVIAWAKNDQGAQRVNGSRDHAAMPGKPRETDEDMPWMRKMRSQQ